MTRAINNFQMEDNQNLLTNILKKRYANVPEKLQQINSLVSEYTKGNGTKMDYEKILNALHGMIANDVPQNILLYFLTTIPLPNENIGKCDSESDLFNLMQKSRITLPESINNSLRKYFNELTNNAIRTNDTNKEVNNEKESAIVKTNNKRDTSDNNEDDVFVKPKRKSKVSRKINNSCYDYNLEDCKSLLDISAQYVVTNFSALHQFYKRKNEMVWNILHTNPRHEVAQVCFAVLKDLNKKRKWLRMIDSNNVSVESLRDEFKGGFSLIKKLQKPELESRMNSFEVTDELKDAVIKYISS